MRKEKITFPFPAIQFDRNGSLPNSDPLGSYTGVPDDPNEKPVQDADDL